MRTRAVDPDPNLDPDIYCFNWPDPTKKEAGNLFLLTKLCIIHIFFILKIKIGTL